jgi:hypothetical protein
MSSRNPQERTDPEHNLTPPEIDDLNRLEAIAQHGLGAYVDVGKALTQIRDQHLYRDSHPSFEAYLRERWAVPTPAGELEQESGTALRSTPCEALARACEETLSALGGEDQMDIEIHVAVRSHENPVAPSEAHDSEPPDLAQPMPEALLPTLRWLLTRASGTLGLISHQLETRAADIDDSAREQLRDDLFVLDDELGTVKALLLEPIDWDDQLTLLLSDELPPFEPDADPYDDE